MNIEPLEASAIGTPEANDTAFFAIEAKHIVSIKVGGTKEPMQAGRSNDLFNLRNPLAPPSRPASPPTFTPSKSPDHQAKKRPLAPGLTGRERHN